MAAAQALLRGVLLLASLPLALPVRLALLGERLAAQAMGVYMGLLQVGAGQPWKWHRRSPPRCLLQGAGVNAAARLPANCRWHGTTCLARRAWPTLPRRWRTCCSAATACAACCLAPNAPPAWPRCPCLALRRVAPMPALVRARV